MKKFQRKYIRKFVPAPRHHTVANTEPLNHQVVSTKYFYLGTSSMNSNARGIGVEDDGNEVKKALPF